MKYFNYLPLIIIFSFLSSTAFSQVINIEKERYNTDSLGVNGSLNGNFNYLNNGNKVMTIGGGGNVNYQSPNDLIFLIGDYQLSETNNENLNNLGLLHLRYIRQKENQPLTFESYVQHSFNEINKVDSRLFLEAGGRYTILENEPTRINFGLGALYEIEKLSTSNTSIDTTNKNNDWRLNSYLSAGLFPSKDYRFFVVAYYLPKFSSFDDARSLGKLTAELDITKELSIDITGTYTYDPFPALDAQKDNSVMKVGLTYDF